MANDKASMSNDKASMFIYTLLLTMYDYIILLYVWTFKSVVNINPCDTGAVYGFKQLSDQIKGPFSVVIQ